MNTMAANDSTWLVRSWADRLGSHFFDADALRFFSGRVLGECWHVGDLALFVTSEKFRGFMVPDGERRYTVRVMREGSLSFKNIGGFQAYDTARAAKRAASRAAHLLSILG